MQRSDREGVEHAASKATEKACSEPRRRGQGDQQSAQIVYRLIEQENQRGIATEKIFLAGFSQGGAIALFAGLRLHAQLAGIIALSAYLPDETTIEVEKSIHNQKHTDFHGSWQPGPIDPAADSSAQPSVIA